MVGRVALDGPRGARPGPTRSDSTRTAGMNNAQRTARTTMATATTRARTLSRLAISRLRGEPAAPAHAWNSAEVSSACGNHARPPYAIPIARIGISMKKRPRNMSNPRVVL